MKKYILLLLPLFLLSCHSREIGFTYSPSEPRAGQLIKFTNTSETGDTWSWNFGDGSSSTVKSPTKIYKSAGTYTVVLRVDDRKSMTYTSTIVVVDSIPQLQVSDTVPSIYSNITCSVMCYNPNNLKVEYLWMLSDNAVLADSTAHLTDSAITVYMTEPESREVIKAAVTIGSRTDTISYTVKVRDMAAPTLLLTTTADEFCRQRAFVRELGSYIVYPFPLKANQLSVYESSAFAFTDDGVWKIDNGAIRQVVESANPVITGTVLRDTLYWKSAADKVHCLPLGQLGAPVASETSNEMTGSLADSQQVLNAVYMTNDGKDLCFAGDGCLIGNKSSMAVQKISALEVDKINGKVFLIDSQNGMLAVANAGDELTGITPLAPCNGNKLAIDYNADRIYYTYNNQLFCFPLLHTINNVTTANPKLLNDGVATFAFDPRLLLADDY